MMEGEVQEKKAEEVPKTEPEKVPVKAAAETPHELYLQHFMEQRTTYTVSRTENPDSLEIGTQKDGRIKVYGDFGKKAEFAAKVKDAIDITEAAQERMRKLEQNGKE